MADPVSQEVELKRALAQYLHDQQVGVYKAGTIPYTATERGIFTNGPDLPTTLDNCIVLTSRRPIPEGRSNLVFPIDILSRVKGNRIAAGNLAGFIFDALDHKEGVPPGMHISWAWEFSRLDYSADSNGRTASIQTFYFRGRRRGA
ncbi:hypothetical protein [Mycetocola miduiensis]|uniref:Gp37 protein n=1 Tax=Mycetocola miduiensis TaxID=995034 RepID=A0A1I5AUN3_9MICO|nr:hypothetical protein [Mycetocola miduiensis]SFN66147.1 hypothetical protein SAMN05216219_1550 [Mycetocola miduiensis]